MAEPDVVRLIRHRLRAAGRPEDAIGRDAIAQIARHSAGVPGAVVRVCRRAMQIAENRSQKTVTADIVAEAIGEEISGMHRGSSHPELVASAPKPNIAPEPSPRPAASQASIAARAPSPDVESRPVPSPKPRDSAPAPEPSLVREPHLSIPEVILGHHPLSGQVQRRRGGRRLKLMLALAGVFLVVLAAGLAVLFGNPHELADRARTSAIDGPVGNVGASPAYDSPTAPPTASAMASWSRAPVTTPAPLREEPKRCLRRQKMRRKVLQGRLRRKLQRFRRSLADRRAQQRGRLPRACRRRLLFRSRRMIKWHACNLPHACRGLSQGHRLTCRSASPKASLAQFTSSPSYAA